MVMRPSSLSRLFVYTLLLALIGLSPSILRADGDQTNQPSAKPAQDKAKAAKITSSRTNITGGLSMPTSTSPPACPGG